MAYSEAQYVIDELAKKAIDGCPDPVTYVALGYIATGGVAISITKPDDTIINGVTLVKVGKIVVVRKENSAPTSITDGTVVVTFDRDYFASRTIVSYNDTEVATYKTWYYAVYTISMAGTVNVDPVVRNTNGIVTRFAYHQDFTVLDPDQSITYLKWGDLDSSATPMHTNSDTGTVTYGSFQKFFVLTNNKPYMVKTDFTADYALSLTNYNSKRTGAASDVSNTSYSGLGAYAWFPRFYMKEVYAADGNSRDVYISEDQVDPNFKAVGFYDYAISTSTPLKGVWIPMYYIGADGKSFAGRSGYGGTTYITCDQQKVVIDQNGANARFLGGSFLNAFRDLCYGLYKSTDIQKHGGYGNCSGYDDSSSTLGTTDNPVLSNGAVTGFYGTGTADDRTTRKQANKAFHSNVLFTYDMNLRDPYTLAYGNGSGSGQVIRIRTTNRYDITANTSLAEDVYTSDYRRRSAGRSAKLDMISTKQSTYSCPTSINYGDNSGSDSTGLCDFGGYGYTSGYSYIAQRLGDCSDGLMAGPAYLRLNNRDSAKGWLLGAAPMLIPPTTSYEPS